MTFSLQQLARRNGESDYYDPDFRVMIENHIPHLKAHQGTQRVVIPDQSTYRQEHDFYGLLLELDVLTQYHWIVLRLNDMSHPNQYNGQNHILMPAVAEIERLRKNFLTNHRI